MLAVIAHLKLMGRTDTCGFRRAYSGWHRESVTRGDRRRRELAIRETVSAARWPARIDGAVGVLDLLGWDEQRAVFIEQAEDACPALLTTESVLVCSPRDKSMGER